MRVESLEFRVEMKIKIIWMIALLMGVAACTDDVLTADEPTAVTDDSQPVPLMVDSYQGRMNTTRGTIESTGFGVYASYDPFGKYHNKWNEAHNYVSTPNYMFNTRVSYDTDHWTYSPLRYWPNEQTNNSWYAGTRTNTLSFFAYAPYVSYATPPTTGITALPGNPPTQLATQKSIDGVSMFDYLRPEWMTEVYNEAVTNSRTDVLNYDCDPIVTYKLNTADLTDCTDLLVGVVASDNTISTYDGVREHTETVRYPYQLADGTIGYREVVETNYEQLSSVPTDGKSYMNMIKPSLGTKLKFRFIHALAGLRVNIRADWEDDDDTRITLGSLKIGENGGDASKGFYTEGELNLRTVKSLKPNWVYSSFAASSNTKHQIDFAGKIHANLLDVSSGLYSAQPEGVRAAPKNVLTGVTATSSDPMLYLIPVGTFVQDEDDNGNLLWEDPPTNSVPLYTTAPYTDAAIPIEVEYYATTSDGTRWHAKSDRYATLTLQAGRITTLTIVLSMDDVTFNATLADWPVGYESSSEIDLPENK